MSRTLKRLQGLGTKVGAFALSGVLALSMTPSVALASNAANGGLTPASSAISALDNGEQDDATGLVMATVHKTQVRGQDAYDVVWPDGKWLTPSKDSDDNTIYTYQDYVKGDGAHYGHYDLETSFTVDSNAKLVAINMTSQGLTPGGKWGTLTPHGGSGLLGLLPSGVKNTADAASYATDQTVKTIGLEGCGTATTEGSYGGYVVNEVSLRKVGADGKVATKEVIDEDDGDKEIVAVGYDLSTVTKNFWTTSIDNDEIAWSAEDKSLKVKDTESGYNVLCVEYRIGDYYIFEQRTALTGEDGVSTYVNEKSDLTTEPSGIGKKNRDTYSAAAYGIIVQNELSAWLPGVPYSLDDQSEESKAAFDAALSDIDTVSAATKSSHAIIEAAYASQGIEWRVSNQDEPKATVISGAPRYFTAISDNLKIQIDGKDMAPDATKVISIGSGKALVSRLFGDDVPLGGFDFYKTGNEQLTAAQEWSLTKTTASFTHVSYRTQATGEHNLIAEYGTSPDDKLSDEAFKYDPDSKMLTVLDPDVTYVVVQFGVGKLKDKAFCGVAYKLDDEALQDDSPTVIKSVEFTGESTFVYDGAAKTPAVSVKDANDNSIDSDRYTVSYKNNINAGTGKVVVVGDSEKSVYGSAAAEFAIEKASLTGGTAVPERDQKVKVVWTDNGKAEGNSEHYTFDRTAHKPTAKVTYGETTLKPGADYTVGYADNVSAGTGYAAIIGKGNYLGAFYDVHEFTIDKAEAIDIKFTGNSATFTYDGKEHVLKAEGTWSGFTDADEIEAKAGEATGRGSVKVGDVSSTNAGKLTLGYTEKNCTATSPNYKKVNVSVVDGSLTINQAPSTVSLKDKSVPYTGSPVAIDAATVQGPTESAVTYVYYSDKACKHEVAPQKVKDAGAYYVKATVAESVNYESAVSRVAQLTISQLSNFFATKNASVSLKQSAKAQAIAASKYTTKAGQGTMTYKVKLQVNAKTGKNVSYFSIDKKGKVSVKAKTPRGTYKVTLNATAGGNTNYKKSATKNPVLTVTVK